MEGGVLDQGEDTSGIGSAKEQGDAEGEAVEDFLKTKIGRGLTREDIKGITKKEGGWEVSYFLNYRPNILTPSLFASSLHRR